MAIITEAQAKRRVITAVQQVKAALGLQTAPQYQGVNDQIAKHLGIVIQEAALPFDEGMYIQTDPPKVVIDLSAADQDRLNFTYFHEITHHLIRQDDELYEYLHENAFSNLQLVIEKFSNIGAAEFLIPSVDISRIIQEKGFSIQLIRELDELFPASKPAIAIQLAQAAQHQCAIVICEYGPIPQQTRTASLLNMPADNLPQLFVRYSSSSPSFRYSIGRFVAIPGNHVITASYSGQCSLTGIGLIPFRSGKVWQVDCEAFFYRGKVYAVFNVDTPVISQNQLAFEF